MNLVANHSTPVSENDAASTKPASATIVICVESGPLEIQSLWAVESLRKWGGRFANCDVVAVTPRRGFNLQAETMRRFAEMNVRWLKFNGTPEWSFYGPFNKPLALAAVEREVRTDIIMWMDSDVLIVGEPDQFLLEDGNRFAAHPCSCHHDIGSTGPEHDHDPFWKASLAGHGIPEDQYPMIETQPGESGPMRMYWQAGAFAYRREDRVGETFLQATRDQLDLDISSRHAGTYFHEQIGLAVAVHRLGLPYRVVSNTHNYPVNKIRFDEVDAAGLAEARIVHYFGSAWEDSFPRLIEIIAETRPDVAEWFQEKGPLNDRRNLCVRAMSRLLRHMRKRRSTRYSTQCRVY